MRLRNTLLLALVSVLLGAYLYFFELKKDPAGKGERLLPFKEEEVDSLILSYPDQEIRIKKESSGKWKITHPLEAAADESTVSDVLSALATIDIERTIEKKPSAEDLQAFGLDKPKVKVSIGLHKAKTLPAVLVGAKTPVGNSSYVQRQSDPAVLLTNGSLPASLEKTLYDFRDKKIFAFPQDRVAKLHIQSPKESFILVKGEKEGWMAEAPRRQKAQEGTVTAYLTTLGRIRAKGFAEGELKDLKRYGLDRPSLKISLGSHDGKNVATLLVGERIGEDYYAKREDNPSVYTIEEFSYRQLNKQLADFLGEETKDRSPAGGATK